ncbi:putative type II secretion system protein E [compost metagenome]
MRSFLRHDPDVILVGEIRDTETARLAVQASLTGHLVLATVHTNDAATTPSRLVDMGVERYLLGDALIGVLAQRLAARLCPNCKTQSPLSDDEQSELSEAGLPMPTGVPWRANGCPSCGDTGRKGRRAVSELMLCDAEISERIGGGASAADVRALARSRPTYTSLRSDALEQSLDGWLDWGDAWRVAER